jgi:hypothetical protein
MNLFCEELTAQKRNNISAELEDSASKDKDADRELLRAEDLD